VPAVATGELDPRVEDERLGRVAQDRPERHECPRNCDDVAGPKVYEDVLTEIPASRVPQIDSHRLVKRCHSLVRARITVTNGPGVRPGTWATE
jgi:hypothetical protein